MVVGSPMSPLSPAVPSKPSGSGEQFFDAQEEATDTAGHIVGSSGEVCVLRKVQSDGAICSTQDPNLRNRNNNSFGGSYHDPPRRVSSGITQDVNEYLRVFIELLQVVFVVHTIFQSSF